LSVNNCLLVADWTKGTFITWFSQNTVSFGTVKYVNIANYLRKQQELKG